MIRAAVVCAGVAAATALGVGPRAVVLAMRPTDAITTLHVSGDVGNVVPGGPSVPLTLTLRNTGDAPARVSTVTATPSGSPWCAPAYLGVGTWRGALTVPAGGAAQVSVPVRLAAATPAACAAMVWRLAYLAE